MFEVSSQGPSEVTKVKLFEFTSYNYFHALEAFLNFARFLLNILNISRHHMDFLKSSSNFLDSSDLSKSQLGCKNILNFCCHDKKFHNCHHSKRDLQFSLGLRFFELSHIQLRIKKSCLEGLMDFTSLPHPFPSKYKT